MSLCDRKASLENYKDVATRNGHLFEQNCFEEGDMGSLLVCSACFNRIKKPKKEKGKRGGEVSQEWCKKRKRRGGGLGSQKKKNKNDRKEQQEDKDVETEVVENKKSTTPPIFFFLILNSRARDSLLFAVRCGGLCCRPLLDYFFSPRDNVL